MKVLQPIGFILATSFLLPVQATELPGSDLLNLKARLGKQLFFDVNLSEPAGQACSNCHDPEAAFSDPDRTKPTSKGVNPDLHGNRNSPTVMYSAYAPAFYFDKASKLYLGGQFHDGRAATLSEQAQGPFLNPLEMANLDAEQVVQKVRAADYAEMFDNIYGADALTDSQRAYTLIADAITEFERSPVFNRFSSKYDFYLFGKAQLTQQERRGLKIFETENKAYCVECHPNRPQNGKPPLFTDFGYDNIGVPKNPENPFYQLPSQFNPDGALFVDLGLGGSLKRSSQNGKFKVPTLRNIDLTAPYMHNGYFPTLRGVVEFYNSRDTRKTCRNPASNLEQALREKCWPESEVVSNINHAETGSLQLSSQELSDLVAFLKTLTDGYRPVSPWRYSLA